MFVGDILPTPEPSLTIIAPDATMATAARLLRKGTDILVVCDESQTMTGVVTKTDVVSWIGRTDPTDGMIEASVVMSRDVLSYQKDDDLHRVWTDMKRRGLKNVPVVDAARRPIGMLTARAVLQGLLLEVEDEEALLRDYVMGVGYR